VSTFEARCERLGHAPRMIVSAAGAIALAFGLSAMVYSSPQRESKALGLSMGIELGVLALGYAWWVLRRKPNAVREPVQVRAGDGEVWIDDERIEATEIRDGVLQHKDESFVVKITRRRGPAIDLAFPSVEEAHGLLQALGKDASQSVVRFRAASRLFAYGGALFATLAVLGPTLGFIGMLNHTAAPVLALALVSLFGFLWPSHVDVGPDGIRHEWLWWKKFIPSTKIAKVAQIGERRALGLQISCGEEDPHEIHVLDPDREALEQRIRDIAGQTPDADAPSVLARGGMEAHEWIATLRALANPATYRSASVDLESLWRVVESASASREDRAAAAVVVARDEASRTRLRVAADAIAEPKLRIAIEAVAEDDIETLEQALDDLREL
jgi:hypothetical protein